MKSNYFFIILSFLCLNSKAEKISTTITSIDSNNNYYTVDNKKRIRQIHIKDVRLKHIFPKAIIGSKIYGEGTKKEGYINFTKIDSLCEPLKEVFIKNNGIGLINFNCCGNKLIIYKDTLKNPLFRMKLIWSEIGKQLDNTVFQPYTFTIINDIHIKIRVLEDKGRWYKIVVNEEKDKIGWLSKQEMDSSLQFNSWEDEILNAKIGISPIDNNYAFYITKPDIFSDTIIPRYGCIQPVEVKGIWLKAKEECSDIDLEMPRYFWLLWRNDKEILFNIPLEY